ncbi:GLPGLI family protein [Pedobacter sp. PLR]|uniref:GLPGLI family protein n=1 Tax=Pedobacter sp. PLR TaxID=2994465 RepID=UPI002246C915|nr:GLPGLI family protein [Pedobacter sp. PLR]MCX2451582.1 GLPGLI family protein [Pedobacter sp. PLR]
MKTFITIVLVLIKVNTFAQQKDNVVGKVFYTFKHMSDTTQQNSYREENMKLYVGKSLNEYFSADQEKKDSLRLKQIESGGGFVINTGGKKTTATQILTDKVTKKIIIKESLIKKYYYEDAYPNIIWKITSEVKEIGDIKCTKAEGNYKGRVYYAWFTTELPLTGAPWKLLGLPGLVLEAYDTKKQVMFLFAGIEKNHGKISEINLEPPGAIKTTKKDYLQMETVAKSDPMGFINSTAADAGSGLQLSTSGANGNFKPKKPSNPVELKDN